MDTQPDSGDSPVAAGLNHFRLSPSNLRKLGKSLKPAFLLPAQFYDPPLRAHRTRGEVALMAAVLDAAVSDFHLQFVKHGLRPQRLAREAEEWMLQDDTEWPFPSSISAPCSALSLTISGAD